MSKKIEAISEFILELDTLKLINRRTYIDGGISALLQKICNKNKKTGDYFKIRILKLPPRHLSPSKHGDYKEYPLVGC
jgi:hypothetical protein